MPLSYKLEYNHASETADDGVYVHLRLDPQGYYRSRIGKEAYYESDDKDSFANGLFAVGGVEEISVMAYRVWIMKSPVYSWEEVNGAALTFMSAFLGQAGLYTPIQGSANIAGEGLRLESEVDRRLRTF